MNLRIILPYSSLKDIEEIANWKRGCHVHETVEDPEKWRKEAYGVVSFRDLLTWGPMGKKKFVWNDPRLRDPNEHDGGIDFTVFLSEQSPLYINVKCTGWQAPEGQEHRYRFLVPINHVEMKTSDLFISTWTDMKRTVVYNGYMWRDEFEGFKKGLFCNKKPICYQVPFPEIRHLEVEEILEWIL